LSISGLVLKECVEPWRLINLLRLAGKQNGGGECALSSSTGAISSAEGQSIRPAAKLALAADCISSLEADRNTSAEKAAR
jgi:hypothetical protein